MMIEDTFCQIARRPLASCFLVTRCLLAIACLGGNADVQLSAQESRADFFAKFVQIQEAMTKLQVTQLLREPDDTWTRTDCKVIPNQYVFDVWCYGTSFHLGCPTLGRIEFDKKGTVRRVVGNSGTPIGPDAMSEIRLQQLMQELHDGPRMDGDSFDPHKLLLLANEFQPLGQDTAFLVFQEYMRVCGHDAKGEDAIYLLLRILHEIPPGLGFLPEAYIGEPYPAYPDDLRLFPRFPIHVVDDVPLLLVRGYFVAGSPEPVVSHMTQYAGRIEWRKSALEVPDTTEKPLIEGVRKLRESDSWFFPSYESERSLELLSNQIRRFASSRREQSSD